jgi:hypothetical protein
MKRLRETHICGIWATIWSRKFVFPFLNINLKTEKYEAVISPWFLMDMKPGPSHEEAAERKTRRNRRLEKMSHRGTS